MHIFIFRLTPLIAICIISSYVKDYPIAREEPTR
jgi:hypothetical protein